MAWQYTKKVAILTGSLVTYHKDLVRNTKKTVSIQLREREEGQAENNPLFDVIITIKKNVKKNSSTASKSGGGVKYLCAGYVMAAQKKGFFTVTT